MELFNKKPLFQFIKKKKKAERLWRLSAVVSIVQIVGRFHLKSDGAHRRLHKLDPTRLRQQ